MAELVDALVSNTSVFTGMPVRVRLGVQKQSEKQSESGVSPLFFFILTLILKLNPTNV